MTVNTAQRPPRWWRTGSRELPAPERLARALERDGDPAVAHLVRPARAGEYDELRSPLACPRTRLAAELRGAGRPDLADRAEQGDWAPTEAEAAAWVASPEGQRDLAGFDAGAYDHVLKTLLRLERRLPDDVMAGLVARRVAATDEPVWAPETDHGPCRWVRDGQLDGDPVHAVHDLVRRTHGVLRVGHHRGHRVWTSRPGWYLLAGWPDGRRVVADRCGDADTCADALAVQILRGARCVRCCRPAEPGQVNPGHIIRNAPAPAAGTCRWARYDRRWVGACGAGL